MIRLQAWHFRNLRIYGNCALGNEFNDYKPSEIKRRFAYYYPSKKINVRKAYYDIGEGQIVRREENFVNYYIVEFE